MWIQIQKYSAIRKVVSDEHTFASSEHTFSRVGNPKYNGSESDKFSNQVYSELMGIMETSVCFEMLITSKRVNIYELCKNTLSFIDDQNYLMLVMSLRSLIERIAYYDYFVRQTKNNPLIITGAENDPLETIGNFEETLRPKIIRGLFQTSSEIRHLNGTEDIRTLKLSPYQKQEDDIIDRSTLNILTPIKQLDKKLNGVLNCYALLSEFLHPNFGDLELASSNFSIQKNEFGDDIIYRTISDQRTLSTNSEAIITQSIEIIDDLCSYYLGTINDIEIYLQNLQNVHRHGVHDLIKTHGIEQIGLKQDTKCPCMSGQKISNCIKVQ